MRGVPEVGKTEKGMKKRKAEMRGIMGSAASAKETSKRVIKYKSRRTQSDTLESPDMTFLEMESIGPAQQAQYLKYQNSVRDFCQEFGGGWPPTDETGVYDNTLFLDNPSTTGWLGPRLQQLVKGLGAEDKVFNFSADQFREELQAAGRRLGLQSVHTYQLRHGGASEDLNSKVRSYMEVKERGCWRTDASLRRYAKSGRSKSCLRTSILIIWSFAHAV